MPSALPVRRGAPPSALVLLAALGCAPVHPPPPTGQATVAPAPEPADPGEKLAWMVGSDPLVRRPSLPAQDGVPGGLDGYLALARLEDSTPQRWWEVEAGGAGTLAVPFARGARLATLETAVGDAELAESWLLPLPAARGAADDLVRAPLAWLGASDPAALLAVVERQVLLGWLDGPGIDVRPAVKALDTPTYDRLAVTPAGRLLLARGRAAADATAAAQGRAWLEDATWLAMLAVAADRDEEQVKFKATRAEVATRLGVQGDPVPSLLTRADEHLARDAATPASLGGALLAQAALRWTGKCPDAPCGGLDRVAAMQAAGRWDPGVASLAAAWQVVALDAALDHLEVAYDRPTFPAALDEVVEALVALGDGSVDRTVLRRARPGPALHLALCRAAGGGDGTTKEEMFAALRARNAALAKTAAPTAPERLREPLERVARRSR